MNLEEFMIKNVSKEKIEQIYKEAEKEMEAIIFNRQMNKRFMNIVKEKTNMSYEDISKKICLNKDIIIDMEKGKIAFSFRKIRKMAELLGFSFDFNLTARWGLKLRS
jgi:ribosome-binding protein aMBF1 (putative translation factor)